MGIPKHSYDRNMRTNEQERIANERKLGLVRDEA